MKNRWKITLSFLSLFLGRSICFSFSQDIFQDNVSDGQTVSVINDNLKRLYQGKLDFRPGEIIPKKDSTYTLGSSLMAWESLYVDAVQFPNLRSSELNASEVGIMRHTSGPLLIYYGNASDLIFKSNGTDKAKLFQDGGLILGNPTGSSKGLGTINISSHAYYSNGSGVSARAYVNFGDTGSVTINKAFNVSSVSRNGSGDYTINFTNPMPDANYSAFISGRFGAGTTFVAMEQHDSPVRTTSALRIYTLDGTFAPTNAVICSVVIFD